MRSKILKKLCAVSLSVLMVGGAGLAEVVPFVSASLPVYAATAETPASSFECVDLDDGTCAIQDYTGTDTDVVIPSMINGKKVTVIGRHAFVNAYKSKGSIEYYGKTITCVTIPDTVTTIEEDAFLKCGNLTSVSLSNGLKVIGDSAFYQCEGLTTLTVPNSVTTIGESAFCSCSGLKKVVLGNGVQTIGQSAFYECSSMTSLTLGNQVKTIGTDAFEHCSKLTDVTIPASTKEVGTAAFSYCSQLKTATVENGTIGAEAFMCCRNLTSVTLGNAVKTIGNNAFWNCSSLKKIRGNKGSYAETYAKRNGYTFTPVEFDNQSTLSSESIKLGATVTINCKASLGTLPYTYAVYYRKSGTTDWKTLQAYKAVATVKFTPTEATSYEIRVNAKDKQDNVVRKDFTVTVMTNTSKLGAESIKLGEKVKVRCFAEGGAGEYQYAVYYKKKVSSHWTKVRDYGTYNIIMLKPAAAVKYDVRVDIKDKSGMVVSKTLTLTVTK